MSNLLCMWTIVCVQSAKFDIPDVADKFKKKIKM